jgi:hypothetical protein
MTVSDTPRAWRRRTTSSFRNPNPYGFSHAVLELQIHHVTMRKKEGAYLKMP